MKKIFTTVGMVIGVLYLTEKFGQAAAKAGFIFGCRWANDIFASELAKTQDVCYGKEEGTCEKSQDVSE